MSETIQETKTLTASQLWKLKNQEHVKQYAIIYYEKNKERLKQKYLEKRKQSGEEPKPRSKIVFNDEQMEIIQKRLKERKNKSANKEQC